MTVEAAPPPASLPEPTGDEILITSGRLTRIYHRDGPHPTTWSRFRHHGPLATGRFDPHEPAAVAPQSRGVMYLARKGEGTSGLTTAVVEFYQGARVIDPSTRAPWTAMWTPVRPLALLDLGSTWTLRAGGNQALAAGDRNRAQEWARRIYTDLTLDGITWTSSLLGRGRCLALFDRAADALPSAPDLHRPLGDPALRSALARTAATVGYQLP